MSAEGAKQESRPNVAIVGSSSLVGKELKQVLEERKFPLHRLTLLETEEYLGLLAEFEGEIQITQIISSESMKDIDVAFFACCPEIMDRYIASAAPFPALTIDLTQTGRRGTAFVHGVSDPRLLKPRGYFLGPHPASIVMTQVLWRLHNTFGLDSAAVTVLEPASERGSPAVDELQEQTVNLLNFQPIPNNVFSSQLAFNILPEEKGFEKIESTVIDQMWNILGRTFPMPLITFLQAPVFHSHGFSMFVRLLESPEAQKVVDLFRTDRDSIFVHDQNLNTPSPISVVGTDTIHIGRIKRDARDPNAFSFWIVADNLRLAASNAVRIAESIVLAPALET